MSKANNGIFLLRRCWKILQKKQWNNERRLRLLISRKLARRYSHRCQHQIHQFTVKVMVTRFGVKAPFGYYNYLFVNLELRDTIAISLSNTDGTGWYNRDCVQWTTTGASRRWDSCIEELGCCNIPYHTPPPYVTIPYEGLPLLKDDHPPTLHLLFHPLQASS